MNIYGSVHSTPRRKTNSWKDTKLEKLFTSFTLKTIMTCFQKRSIELLNCFYPNFYFIGWSVSVDKTWKDTSPVVVTEDRTLCHVVSPIPVMWWTSQQQVELVRHQRPLSGRGACFSVLLPWWRRFKECTIEFDNGDSTKVPFFCVSNSCSHLPYFTIVSNTFLSVQVYYLRFVFNLYI